MFRSRNLDIALAALVAILGGLAAAKNMPGQIMIPLGVGLFLAPGYLWTEALLSQRMPGHERAMFSIGMALVVPVFGGFLLAALKIPLFKKDWVGVLVVFALLGVVAALIQRLRQVPEDREPEQDPRLRQRQRPAYSTGSVVMNTFVYGVAAVIGLGAIGYSVKSAEDQPFPAQTEFWFAPVINNPLAVNMAALSDNTTAQGVSEQDQETAISKATQANILVLNTENQTETYEVRIIRNGKVDNSETTTFTLQEDQEKTWDVPYSPPNDYDVNAGPNKSEILADLYLVTDPGTPIDFNTTAPIDYGNNGGCVSNLKLLPTVLQSEDPCYPDPAATASASPTPTNTTVK